MTKSLYDQWLEHCKKSGHAPVTEGGAATYVMTIAQHRIECEAPDCTWIQER